MKPRKRVVIYILASRYDDEGYVLRYWRGILPSNSLAVLTSLTRAAADRGELGGDDLSVESYDDTVQRIPVKRIVRRHQKAREQIVVGLVGVQSNQFPRATDLALQFREAGIPVVLGGFHVSGVLAMNTEPTPELQRLIDAGVGLVAGEAEAPGFLSEILEDAFGERLKPIYRASTLPDLEDAALPEPDTAYLRRFRARDMATIDTSRGCPFNCSFCTVINVQGRKVRHRSAESVLEAIERNYRAGVRFYFFTDDNFARSPIRDPLLDGLIALRARGVSVSFLMQVDTQAYQLPGFVDKASRAGCFMAFIGMESVNPANIAAAGKSQNKAGQYREMVEKFRDAKILVHVGYIIGLPHDTPESVRNDIEALRDDVQVDEASFFMLTPLPGSRDHKRMVDERIPIDADLNNFDSTHETFRHPHFAPGQWLDTYRLAWRRFYTKESIINIMLRVSKERYWQMFWTCVWYRFSTVTDSHPMFTGLIRLKDRAARRALFPRENILAYAWRRTRELSKVASTFASLFIEFQEVWMLTRKQDDPRWRILADLRARWADVQRRLQVHYAEGGCEDALRDLQQLLHAAAERLRQVSAQPGIVRRKARRMLGRTVVEIEERLAQLDVHVPTWHNVVETERYVAEGLLSAYENAAIRYVARRRRFNEYRRELLSRFKAGRVWGIDLSPLPRAVAFELALGLRFGLTFVTHI